MLTMLSSTMLCSLLFGTSPMGKEPPVPGALELVILRVTLPNGIVIEMRNTSSAPVRLWRESNTWGVARWRVMRIRDGNAVLFYQVPIHGFTRNVPAFDEVSGESRVQRLLDLTEAAWRSTGSSDRSIRAGDLVIVFYDVPVTDEATRLGVWHGAIAASSSVSQ
jgi:hypothetical protein